MAISTSNFEKLKKLMALAERATNIGERHNAFDAALRILHDNNLTWGKILDSADLALEVGTYDLLIEKALKNTRGNYHKVIEAIQSRYEKSKERKLSSLDLDVLRDAAQE